VKKISFDNIDSSTLDAVMIFLEEYHAKRDYFECHEILEHKWKEEPQGSRHDYWVSLLQIAVSNYHYRRGNFNGAKKLIEKALQKIEAAPPDYELLGFDYESFKTQVKQILENITNEVPYYSINLSLTDELKEKYENYCKNKGIEPFILSDMHNEALVNKHLKEYRD